jgi:hypothetical protein
MSGWIIFGLIIYCLLLTVVLLWVMNYIEIYTTRKSRRKYEEQQSARGLSRFEQGKVGANKDLGQSEDKKILPGSGGGSRHLDEQVSGTQSSTDDGFDEELGQPAPDGGAPTYGATSPYKELSAYSKSLPSSGAPLRERLAYWKEVIR